MENYTSQSVKEPEDKVRQMIANTPLTRWLVLICAVLGTVFALVIVTAMDKGDGWVSWAPAYALFWGLYVAGFYVMTWQRAKGNVDAWLVLGAAALLFVHYAFYKSESIGALNYLAIPMLLMLHSVLVTRDVKKGQEGKYIRPYFMGWFAYPFMNIGRFFTALGTLFKKDGNPTKRAALLGLLFGIPVVVVVASLLMNADSVMGYYGKQLLAGISVGLIISRTLIGLAVAVLFYSFIFTTVYKPTQIKEGEAQRNVEAASMIVVISLLLVVYAVFAYFQFAYLTGIKGLPLDLTYSEYAVSGFTQLLFVAAINLGVFAFTVSLCKQHRALKPLLLALLAATLVVLYSGIMRLSMYIGAYGLTFARILPMWFMMFLTAAVLLCSVKLFVKRLCLLRACACILIVWYLVLNAINIDAVVANSIIARADARGYMVEQDKSYMRHYLSKDAKAVIDASAYAEEIEKTN
ncbi:MAG: DUF4173 domain-containing protein [Clostridia bacterium]